MPPEEADERRERLLAGFRWILVDEYQDIGPDQYALISALAGRTLDDEAGKLTLFAVGDDDQNIYAFNGASVEFIRRFEADYGPRPIYLTGNYRSTGHIIAAANAVIEPARERMKARHPLHIDRARVKDPLGGPWQELDPVSRGRVQILPAGRNPVSQGRTAMAELLRLAALSPDWDWSRCAVIAREWEYLAPVRAFCEAHGIPSQAGNEEIRTSGACARPGRSSNGCAAGRAVSSTAPPCMAARRRPAIRWKRVLWIGGAGSCWTGRGRWWGALPRASHRRTGRGAGPPRFWPLWDGAAKHQSHNTATPSNAMPGRWSFPNWCSSRTNSYNAAFDLAPTALRPATECRRFGPIASSRLPGIA